MSALTSLLVRDGVVSVRKIEQALQRQVMSGGDLETVLLEMDAVEENVLAAYRAAVFDAPAASREDVMTVDAEVIALVPADVAIEQQMVPLRLAGRTLHVAVHQPLDRADLERLGFLLGFDIVSHVACEVRIAAGLAHHYDAELAPRLVRLVAKVHGRPGGAVPEVGRLGSQLGASLADLPSKSAPPDLSPPRMPRVTRSGSILLEPAPPEPDEPSEGAAIARDLEPASSDRHTIPAPPEMMVEPAPPSASPSQPPSSLRRYRGPITLAAGERMLRQATDRDQILSVLFAFARQFFDYTALFVVHDDMADGREASGVGASTEEVMVLSVALDRPGAFAEARRTMAPLVRRLDQTESDRELAMGMRRLDSPPALVMPIAIRQRVVLMLYGDRDGDAFDVGSAMELVRFGPRVVEAFEQLIIRKKRAGYAAGEERPSAAPSRDELKQAARDAVLKTPLEPIQVDRTSWQPGRRRTNPGFSPDSSTSDDSWNAVRAAPQRLRPEGLAVSPSSPVAKPLDTSIPPPAGGAPGLVHLESARVDSAHLESAPLESESAPLESAASRTPTPRDLSRTDVEQAIADERPSDPARRRVRRAPSAVLGIPRRAPPPPPSDDVSLRPPDLDEDDEDLALLYEASDDMDGVELFVSDADGEADVVIDETEPELEVTPVRRTPRATIQDDRGEVLALGQDGFASGDAEEEADDDDAHDDDTGDDDAGDDDADDDDADDDDEDDDDADDDAGDDDADDDDEEGGDGWTSGDDAGQGEEEVSIDLDEPEPDEPRVHDTDPPPRVSGTYSLREAPVDVVRHSRPPSERPPRDRMPTPRDRPPFDELDGRARRSLRPTPEERPPKANDDASGDGERLRASPNELLRSDPPTGLDVSTRSVIVDMGHDIHARVSELLNAVSPMEQDRIVQGLLTAGEGALPVLAQAFPGPLRWKREQRGKVPSAAEISPIMRAFVAFGARAGSYVAALLSSAHPDVRFYAAVVASEIVTPELMDAVAERIHDEDAGVRRIAVQLLPRFSSFRGFTEIRTVIRRTARIRGKDLRRREHAIDAVAELRDVEMVPKLIELLRDGDSGLGKRVREALVKITGTDFEHSYKRWSAWWDQNRGRHRLEWLIDSLVDEEEPVRRHAGEELKRITQEYYGYHPGSPKRDRELIAKRYRQWWEAEGHRKFA
ncbi:MAG: hypothetical protein AB7S26_21445 [Sandaracinaceae bacterium]